MSRSTPTKTISISKSGCRQRELSSFSKEAGVPHLYMLEPLDISGQLCYNTSGNSPQIQSSFRKGDNMISTNTMSLKERILPIIQKYDVERVILFGSMARGDADENSDYDFLISKGSLRSLIQYMSFVSELESVLQCHVDVITDTSSDETIIQTAQREGILLYERP